MLARFAVGEATLAQLDAARDRGWITAEEHDAAVHGAEIGRAHPAQIISTTQQIIDATNT